MPPAVRRPRRWPVFLAKVAAANLVVLVLLAAAGELAVRCYREGGIRPALASFGRGAVVPAHLGVGAWLVPDPELGYRLNPAQPGVHDLGIRFAGETAKAPGSFRILHLGDSVSWDEDGFVAIMAARFAAAGRRIEIVNAAIPGYTTHQQRLLLHRCLGPLQPDLVTLQYCLNDHHRFLHQLVEGGRWLITQEARRALLPEGGGLLATLARRSYLALELRRGLLALQQRSASRYPWEDRADFAPAWRDESWPAFAEEFTGIAVAARRASVPLLVVAVPFEPQLRADLLAADRAYTLKPQARLAALAAELGVPLLDLHPLLQAAGGSLFSDQVHLTAAGHQVVAEAMARALDARGLLPGG